MTIDTPRLQLISCDEEMLSQALQSDEALATLMGVQIAAGWREHFGARFSKILERLADCDDTSKGWWTYFAIDTEQQLLIGTASFQGPPSTDGEVEIAYEVAAQHRGKNFGLEMAQGLLSYAFANSTVHRVTAQTYAQNNASTKILQELGFNCTTTIEDAEDGLLWDWKLNRGDFENQN